MANVKILITVYVLCLWCGLSGVSCTKNETAKASKRTSVTGERLSQNERNRRLIPYATYYIAGNQDDGNSLNSASTTPQSDEDDSDATKPVQRAKSVHKHPYQSQNEYGYDYGDNTEYSYIPIAYIPGGRGISYNPETHYYPNSYYQTPISTENAKYYTTAKPKYSTPVTTTEKKFPFSYLTEYVAQQQGVRDNDYYKYLVTPATLKQQANYEPKKPYHEVSVVTTPKSEYLNFRYNLYKTQAPKYDVTTAPSTVEITSPKHYLVNKVVSSTQHPDASHVNHVSTPYSVTYDYADEPYVGRTKAPKFIAKTPEPVTQSTKTLMTIMKSQELPYQQVQTRVQFVPKPYLVPTASDFSVDDILNGYNINKQLPDKITADNIKQSIRTLSYILQVLQKADSISYHKPARFSPKEIFDSLKESHPLSPIEHNSVSPLQQDDPYDPYDPYDAAKQQVAPHVHPEKPYKDEQSTPGRAGIDYPVLSVIPETSFNCKTQRYKGFFADPETKCQVWHYCDLNGGQASFLCPNGTIFNQAALTCDWWFNVKCASTPQLYVLNERLYKYILPVRPSFPEDYSGPLVDQYLTEKFREIESKGKHRYPTNSTSKEEIAANITALSEYEIPSHLLSENL